ncbi:hypothetical protein [Commensalibacter oyaizuii]|uniref:HIG1 domain-containing protein n=1 Tax=Commensalibacter oyaizuii TaxID=3043873 RepID=A0ABT6Q1F4_9PROT|nr:hypothetical protein [Commensalibacter sp. TBRC 16381]MDI2090909.1 hypothetical protein [Commensalibacter sp. TBRC 16381]
MIFVLIIAVMAFVTIPFAKKQAAKKGTTFNLVKHLLKFAGLIVGIIVASLIIESFNGSSQQSANQPIPHIPTNVQRNLQ